MSTWDEYPADYRNTEIEADPPRRLRRRLRRDYWAERVREE